MEIILKCDGVEYEFRDSEIYEPLISHEWFTKTGTTRVIFGELFYASYRIGVCSKPTIFWKIVGKTIVETSQIIKSLIAKQLGAKLHD